MIRSRRDAITVVPQPDEAAGAFGNVASLLWTERELLERLLFQLVAQQLIITAGKGRWLRFSDSEVRATVESLQHHEVVRTAETEPLAGRYGLAPDVALSALADVAPEPWPAILHDHRAVLRELELEIEDVAAQNRRLLQAERAEASHGETG